MAADISIFTPTHNPKFILDVYKSILSQENYNATWEWIIVTNGACKSTDLPQEILSDTRIQIIPANYPTIGALKKLACSHCSGRLVIELDHDDYMASCTFYELIKAHNQTPNGFYYSDFINLKQNGTCETYPEKFGWVDYPVEIDGEEYQACRSFSPSARSICQIYWAPNHIRVWSNAAYVLSGGHNPNLMVGDDHDLLCRTYLANVPFVHIPKPLYIYRRYNGNSFLKYARQIKEEQNNCMNRYLRKLINVECKQNNLVRLDVGSSEMCTDDWKNDDLINNGCNFNQKYEDNSVGCVRAIDVLHKIPSSKLIDIINEIYRILVPGGWFVSSTPSNDVVKGKPVPVLDEQNSKSWWSTRNFDYYTKKEYARLISTYTGRFQKVRCLVNYPSPEHAEANLPYVHADLCALKGQRQPGLCEI